MTTASESDRLVEVLVCGLALQCFGEPLRPEVVGLLVERAPMAQLLGFIGHAVHYGDEGAERLSGMYEQLIRALRSRTRSNDSVLLPGDRVEVRSGVYASSNVDVRVVWIGEEAVAVAPVDLADDYIVAMVPLVDVLRAPPRE